MLCETFMFVRLMCYFEMSLQAEWVLPGRARLPKDDVNNNWPRRAGRFARRPMPKPRDPVGDVRNQISIFRVSGRT
jgi:hypothetical protein